MYKAPDRRTSDIEVIEELLQISVIAKLTARKMLRELVNGGEHKKCERNRHHD